MTTPNLRQLRGARALLLAAALPFDAMAFGIDPQPTRFRFEKSQPRKASGKDRSKIKAARKQRKTAK